MKSLVLELTDQTDRTLIEQELGANIFVEAGAGSGKTHELVERICAMVDAGVELKSVAAITFTEKAAGELRERVRRKLSDPAPTELRLRALNQLDTAPIGTIHSFAARIISEHPIEAGVPPLITVVDELRSQIAFTRRWEAARQKLFTDASIDDALRIILAVGVSLDHLQNVAADLDANWDRLESHPPRKRHIPAVDLGPILRQTAEVLAHADHCTDSADKLFTAFEHIRSWHGRLTEAETGELGLVLELLHSVPQKGFGGGQKGNSSVNVADVRTSCKDLADQATALRNSFVEPAVETVTAAMAEVLVQAARERQHSGELEYHDLLIHARDLLVGEDQAGRAYGAPQSLPLHHAGRVPGHGPHPGGTCHPDLSRRRLRTRRVGAATHPSRPAVHGGRPQAIHLPFPQGRHRHLLGGPGALLRRPKLGNRVAPDQLPVNRTPPRLDQRYVRAAHQAEWDHSA